MAQLTIEYLLYAQEQLAANLGVLAKKYAEKKKSLMSKRRELAELKEEAKALKSLVKTKDGQIEALQDLIRNSKVSKHRRESKRERASPIPPPETPTPHSTAEDVIHFFVSVPDGQCVECHERGSITVNQLSQKVFGVFIGYQNQQNFRISQCYYQGRILQENSTLYQNGIKSGDTLVAKLESLTPIVPKPEPAPQVVQQPPANDLMEFFMRQQETLRVVAIEMR